MNRKLFMALLAAVAISTIGTGAAAAQGNATVTRPIFASDASGHTIGPAVGIVTFNTETGDWTLSTRDRLPQSDANIYYLAISTSPVSTEPKVGRWVEDCFWWTYLWSVNGAIEASGTVEPWQLDLINDALENHGIFLLPTNSI
jgi:hypothetical protein